MIFCYFISIDILKAGNVGEELRNISRDREIKQGVKKKIQVGSSTSILSIIHRGNHK